MTNGLVQHITFEESTSKQWVSYHVSSKNYHAEAFLRGTQRGESEIYQAIIPIVPKV